MVTAIRTLLRRRLLRTAGLIATAAFLSDWLAKSWALRALDTARPIGGLVLDVERNPAFAFSSGAGLVEPWLVAGLRLVTLAAIILLGWKMAPRNLRHAAGLALLVAGGAGNAVDVLVRNGAVVDFIGTGPITINLFGFVLHTEFVFNTADVCIIAGLVLLLPLIRAGAQQVQHGIVAWQTHLLRRARADGSGPATD